jgi:hypothetical protein
VDEKPVVVVGDGWSAFGAVGFLVTSGMQVCWISASGSRTLSPLASLESGPGVDLWAELASRLEIDCGAPVAGSFTREFRNKSFREPYWTKAPTQEAREEVRKELLWEPEQKFAGGFERRFSLTLNELEEEFRKTLLSDRFSNLRRIQGVPLTGFKSEEGALTAVILGSGDVIETDQVIYADRWSLLSALEGLPKPLPFLRKREPMGVLQASFVHDAPLALGSWENFFADMSRESGKDIERHLWGYFSTDGTRSTWTLCLSPEEVEDNHEIAKKLRKLKSTLDKIFVSPPFVSPEKQTFMATVIEEQVRFSEESFFADDQFPETPSRLKELSRITFLTDGYGPSWAFRQVGATLGITVQPKDTESEAENVNTLRTGTF